MLTTQRWLTVAIVAAFFASPVRAADLNKYLPDDAEIVVGINVTTMVESGLVQQHVPMLVAKYGPDLLKLATAGGLKLDEEAQKELLKILGDAGAVKKWLNDNKTLVRRLLIGTSTDFNDANAFLIFEGDFNKDRMKLLLDEVAKNKPFGVVVKMVKQDKHEFYSVQVPGDEDAMHVALADEKTIVCCQDKEALAKALDRGSRDKPGVKKELVEVANKIDPKSTLWMAAAPKEMDEYVSAHGSVFMTDGIRVVASVTSKDADSAKNMANDLKDTLKDAADDLDDLTKQLPPIGALRDILKKVAPKTDMNVVTVEIEVPGATIDKLIKELPAIK